MPKKNIQFMRGITWGFIFLFSALFIDEVSAVDEKAIQVLEKTSAYYQKLENFRAVYHYTLTIQYPELEEPWVHSSNMIITVRGDQYRLKLDEQETITDGETIWVYDKIMKEVTISNYNSTNGLLHFTALHNLYQQKCHPIYIKAHVINRKKNKIQDIIQLIPRSDNEDFKSIRLIIDRATAQIHGFEMVQNEEVSYTCHIKNFSTNIALPDDYFTFNLNAHDLLEVIDLREDETHLNEDEANVDEAENEAENNEY